MATEVMKSLNVEISDSITVILIEVYMYKVITEPIESVP